jgi:hypothetical protein
MLLLSGQLIELLLFQYLQLKHPSQDDDKTEE